MKYYLFVLLVIFIALSSNPTYSQSPESIKQLSASQKDDAKKAILGDDKTFENAIEKVRKTGPLSKNAAEDFIKKFSFPYQQQKSGAGKRTITVEGGEKVYMLYPPAKYTSGKSWPLIISLHGMGGTSDTEYKSWGAHAAKFNGFIACPSVRKAIG